MKYLINILVLLFGLQAGASAGLEIEEVILPDTAQLTADGPELVLNGAGTRKRMMMKAYVGALYLPEKTASSISAIAQQGPKRMAMHVLFPKIPKPMVISGWSKNLPTNTTEAEMARLNDRLETFYGFFRTMEEGDIVYIDGIPGVGTRVTINGEEIGTIQGDDFFPALLKVWIGKDPVDESLKEGIMNAS